MKGVEKLINFQNDILPLKDQLFRLALRMTLNRQEAEDITQETLLRMWQNREDWPKIENIRTYTLTICRRLSLDHMKGAQHTRVHSLTPTNENHEENLSLPSSTPQPDEALDQKQRIEAVRQLIDSLPEIQRTIIQLRDIEGLRYSEIAQATDLTETQVKVYLHRARTKIKEKIFGKL